MPDTSSSTPQFTTAEYDSKPGEDTCRSCNKAIGGAYYRVNGTVACENCVQQLQNQLPKDSHSAFARALLFGVGGAILGLIVYAAFGILTGIMIGYVALAVGYIVGKAMLMGSGGMGGRRYQLAAVAFTYFAVSMAAIPMGISQAIKQKEARQHALKSATNSGAAVHVQEQSVSDDSGEPDSGPDNPPSSRKQAPSLGAAISGLLFLGLASPFLELAEPLQGLIGLVILSVGLRIAWTLTAGTKIDVMGPFGATAPPPPLG
jgi:hypothetical protein